MSARKVQLVPTPVLAKVEGFEVVTSPFANCLPSPDTVSQHQRPKKSVSLLSLEISTSLSSEAIAFTDEELTDTECYTDDEEEERANSPAAIPIAIKDEDAYKVMLRARAIVNCKLWQQSTSQSTGPQ